MTIPSRWLGGLLILAAFAGAAFGAPMPCAVAPSAEEIDNACRLLLDGEGKAPSYCAQPQSSPLDADQCNEVAAVNAMDADLLSAEAMEGDDFSPGGRRGGKIKALARELEAIKADDIGAIDSAIEAAGLQPPITQWSLYAWFVKDRRGLSRRDKKLLTVKTRRTDAKVEDYLRRHGLARGRRQPEAEVKERRRRLTAAGKAADGLGARLGDVGDSANLDRIIDKSAGRAGAAGPGGGMVAASAGGARAPDGRPVKPKFTLSDLAIVVPASKDGAAAKPGKSKPDWKRYMSSRDYSARDRRDAEAVVTAVSRRLEDYYKDNPDAIGDRLSGFPLAGPITNAKRRATTWARSLGAAVGLGGGAVVDSRGSAEHQREALAAAREALPKGSNLEVKAVDVGWLSRHHAVVIYPKGVDPADPKSTGKTLILDPYLAQSPKADDIVYFQFLWERLPSVWPPSNKKIHD